MGDRYSWLSILVGWLLGMTSVMAYGGRGSEQMLAMDRYAFELMAQAGEIYTSYEALGEYTTLSGEPIVTDEEYTALKRKLDTLVTDIEAGLVSLREQSATSKDPGACLDAIDRYQSRILHDFKEKTSRRKYVEKGLENELPIKTLALAKGFVGHVRPRCRQSYVQSKE